MVRPECSCILCRRLTDGVSLASGMATVKVLLRKSLKSWSCSDHCLPWKQSKIDLFSKSHALVAFRPWSVACTLVCVCVYRRRHCVLGDRHQPSRRRWLGDDADVFRSSFHACSWEAGARWWSQPDVLHGRTARRQSQTGGKLCIQVLHVYSWHTCYYARFVNEEYMPSMLWWCWLDIRKVIWHL